MFIVQYIVLLPLHDHTFGLHAHCLFLRIPGHQEVVPSLIWWICHYHSHLLQWYMLLVGVLRVCSECISLLLSSCSDCAASSIVASLATCKVSSCLARWGGWTSGFIIWLEFMTISILNLLQTWATVPLIFDWCSVHYTAWIVVAILLQVGLLCQEGSVEAGPVLEDLG